MRYLLALFLMSCAAPNTGVLKFYPQVRQFGSLGGNAVVVFENGTDEDIGIVSYCNVNGMEKELTLFVPKHSRRTMVVYQSVMGEGASVACNHYRKW